MWKIVVGFVIVAVLALWLLSKGGDVDMSGEKHSVETPAAATTASAPVAASTPASAASQ